MKKLTLLLLLVVSILCCMYTFTGCGNSEQEHMQESEQEAEQKPEQKPEQEASQGLNYELSEDKESYTVVGIGSYDGNRLVVPSEYEGKPVTAIGQAAFYDCKKLTSVTIPDSVTTVGDVAFEGCLIKKVSVPLLVIPYIPNETLETVIISSGENIPESAFKDCKSLTSVTLPNTIKSIGVCAFEGCVDLTGVTLPNSLTSIGYAAFRSCESLTNVTLPNSVTFIGGEAFSSCSSLTSITLPKNIVFINYATFQSCTSLTSITIPDGVTSIGRNAFENCTSLTSITIPNSVTYIGDLAFMGCYKLTSVTFEDATNWSVEDKYYSSGTEILVVKDSSKNAEYLTKTYYYYTWKKLNKN